MVIWGLWMRQGLRIRGRTTLGFPTASISNKVGGLYCQFIGAMQYPGFTGEKPQGQCWNNRFTLRG
jgi:hypothetical protein